MIYITGDMIIDEYLYGTTTRISPEAPVPIVDLQSREKRWGGCGNVWKNVASIMPNTRLSCYWDEANKELFYQDKNNFWLPKIDKIPLKTRVMSNGRYMSRIDDEEWIIDTQLEEGLVTLNRSLAVLIFLKKLFQLTFLYLLFQFCFTLRAITSFFLIYFLWITTFYQNRGQ